MRLLLDTNAYSEMKRGRRAVLDLVRGCDRVLMSAIVVGEILAGFRGGSCGSQNRREFGRFLQSPFVEFIPVTATTADRYSRVFSTLRKKGTPIPTNDLWIAAHVLETGADLVTYDRHFEHVDGLVWLTPED